MTLRRASAAVVVTGALAVPLAWSMVTPAMSASATAAPGAPEKTIPTVPTTSADSLADEPVSGIGIPAAAPLPRLLPIVRDVIGATADVAAELSDLADVPTGIRSPAGSSVREFSISYGGADTSYVATATFTTDATAVDTVVFYQASLSASGFVPIADSGDFAGDPPTQQLRFDNPLSVLSDASVEVMVRDSEPVEVDLTITDTVDERALQAFTGWAAGLPTLDEATPVQATLAAGTVAGSERLSVVLSTTFAYDATTPDVLAREVRDALPSEGFSLDADNDDGGSAIAIRHVALRDVGCVIATATSGATTLEITGTVEV